MSLQLYMNHLGLKARDKVTGLTGVITSVSFDLYGCIQMVVTPAAKPEGELMGGCWFDWNRLEILDADPVMPCPAFDYEKGAADKPIPY
jgi:hypothetical protein